MEGSQDATYLDSLLRSMKRNLEIMLVLMRGQSVSEMLCDVRAILAEMLLGMRGDICVYKKVLERLAGEADEL